MISDWSLGTEGSLYEFVIPIPNILDTPHALVDKNTTTKNPLNINIIQSEYVISIDQKYHIIKNTVREYWVTKKIFKVNYQTSLFPIYTSFESELFMDRTIIGE